jgi:hypothetical protein
MHSYLGNEYGKFGLIICRDNQPGLVKGRELEAFREFYNKGHVIIKITAAMITGILSKLRSPSKTDIGNTLLDKHLDVHIRLYASGQTEPRERGRLRSH